MRTLALIALLEIAFVFSPPANAAELTLAVSSARVSSAVYRYDDRRDPNDRLFSLERSWRESQLAEALDSLERLCKTQPDLCAKLPALELVLQDTPITVDGDSDCADIAEDGRTIHIASDCGDTSLAAFHEMVHAVHYAQLTSADQRMRRPATDWFFEAVAQLATLLYHPRGNAVTEAERSFLRGELRGSLIYPDGDRRAWFGLVALWTRYLRSHLNEPALLLHHWIHLDPLALEGEKALGALELTKETLSPSTAAPPKETLRFENLFNYFVIALGYNEPGLNPWNLFDLEIPAPGETPALLPTFPLSTKIEIPPLGFLHIRATMLKDSPKLWGDSDVRVTLWRQGRKTPIDLRESWPEELDRFDSVVLYNPTLEWKSFSFGSPN